jgi:hypothetical protein
MLDVHPAHHAANTWRDFFIHIATIVVGLLIAVGIEQTVEYFHHRHQLRELREQMHDVLEKNRDSTPHNMEMAARLRASLQSIQARIAAGSAQPAPAPTIPAVDLFPRVPSIAPYEAAKENGTVALLTSEEIRIYNRLALQRDFLLLDVRDLNESFRDLDSFEERFADSAANRVFAGARPNLDIAKLSSTQREQYAILVANVIKRLDILRERIDLFDREVRAVLNGVRDESELLFTSPR